MQHSLTGGFVPSHTLSVFAFLTLVWAMNLVIQSAYSGNLVASLTVNKYTLPVNDLKELAQQTSHRIGVVGGSSHEYVFKVPVIFYTSLQNPNLSVQLFNNIHSMIIIGSLESPSLFLLAFWPKILGGGGDLRMVLYHSMKAGSVVGTLSPLKIDIFPKFQ